MNITDAKVISELSLIEPTDGMLRHVRINTSKSTTVSENPFATAEEVRDENGYVQRPDRKTTEFVNDMEAARGATLDHMFDNTTNYIYMTKTADLVLTMKNGQVYDKAEDFPRTDNGRLDLSNVAEVTQRLDNFVWSRKNGWRRPTDNPVVFRKVAPQAPKAGSPNETVSQLASAPY